MRSFHRSEKLCLGWLADAFPDTITPEIVGMSVSLKVAGHIEVVVVKEPETTLVGFPCQREITITELSEETYNLPKLLV